MSWNQAAEKIFGFSADEALGRHPYELIVMKEEQPQIDEIWHRLLEGDATAHSTNRNVTKEGRQIICDWANTPLRKEDGKILGVLSIVEDVTEIKQAQEALLESEKRYRDLFETATDLIQCLYADGRIDYVNKAWRTTLGYGTGEIIGRNICEFISPQDHEQCRTIFSRPLAGKDIGRILLRFRTKDGDTIWAEGSFSVKFEQEKPVRIWGIFRDFTAQKQAQEALRESEERFRAMVESTSDWLWEVDENCVYTYVSPKIREILGYEPAELIGRTPFDFMPPEENARVAGLFEPIVQARKPFDRLENTNQTKDGRAVVLETSGVPISDREGNFCGYRGMDRDITKRKRMEAELQQTAERLALAQQAGRVGVFDWNFTTGMVAWTPELEDVLGVPIGLFEKKYSFLVDRYEDWAKLLHPEDLSILDALFDDWIKSDRDEEQWEYRVLRQGEKRWILGRGRIIRDPSGKPVRMIGTNVDITERKRAEEELKKQRDQLEEAQEIAKTGSWERDVVNDKITWSKELYRIFEMEPERFKATFEAFLDLVHPEDRQKVRERLAQAFSKKRTYDIEYRITTPNGREKIIHSRGAVIFDPSGKPIFTRGSAQDITHLREKEKEMMKVAKLESLGILAGGIAHDFNNILTSILGNIELAQMTLPPESSAAEKIVIAGRACERAKGLSQQLLTFAKGGAPVKKIHAMPDIIKEAAELALRGSNVKSIYSFPADLRLTEVDETQFSQVVNNLVINADQAMPEGGILEITASNVHLEQGNAQELEPGKYIRIDLKDQGIGIPGKYFDRIFDPYFTTKEKGSGLGLAVCYSIIKKHGGTLTVDSTPGVGSIFSIFLPASEKKQTSEATPREVEFYGTGRVLVMDDDETVLEIATDMLQHLGYQVETVKDGMESLTAYETATALKKGEPFEVLILDLTIPGGMGGKETVQRLLKIDPHAKVIVSSGYANDPIMSDFAEYGFKGVIPKPYKLNELSKTLQDVIGKREE
ncbi:MAG: PAS domain S-box protein [Deltaproteobacteria bacterium]